MWTKALGALIVVGLLAAAVAGFYGVRFLETAPSVSDEPVVFEVKPGESFRTVAHHLEEQGLVTSAWKLEVLARVARLRGKVRVGEYALRTSFRPKELMSVLISGKSIEYPITIPEGSNRFEIAEILAKSELAKIIKPDEFLRLTINPDFIEEVLDEQVDSLEGYLFPETYHLTKYTGARGLIKMMVERFKTSYAKVQQTPGWSRGKLTDRQIVTMASIIEKETMAPEERSVISSVFYNRMKIHMPLQTDPTIIYSIYLDKGSWDGALSHADLQRPGPYNSYLNPDLPPGPIGNPGIEALKAAGMPTPTDYLFFMSLNNGTHTFSRDYAQHAKAVSKYWSDRKTQAGGSWRDLNKRKATPEHVIESKGPKQKQ